MAYRSASHASQQKAERLLPARRLYFPLHQLIWSRDMLWPVGKTKFWVHLGPLFYGMWSKMYFNGKVKEGARKWLE